MLHAKAVPAEGRRNDGPTAIPAVCLSYADGEGEVELTADLPDAITASGRTHGFKEAHLWHWAMTDKQPRIRVTGEAVALHAGDRCIVELKTATGELHSVQVVPRLTGKISSRPSASVGQIEPDESCRAIAGANVFLRLSQVPNATQLPAVGERVQFQLAPNPERAEKLWAAEVVPLNTDSLAAQPVGRVAVTAAEPSTFDGADGGSGADGASQALPPRAFEAGCRVYVGRLPYDASAREVAELFAPFGELVHLQIPMDEMGRRRGFAIVELARPEMAAAAVEKLDVADLRGTQIVVRNDDQVVNQKSGTVIFVGNLGMTTTWQALKAHVSAAGADPSGTAHVRVMATDAGRSLGFGFVEFRTTAAADAAVYMLHNNTLDGRYLFIRLDCDLKELDDLEAQRRRDAHAKNIALVASLATWIDASAPLVDWGWAERHRSCWAPKMEPAMAPPVREDRKSALAFLQFQARLRALVTQRMEVAQLPGLFESRFGARIEPRVLGYTTLREALSEVGGLALDVTGQRPTIAPQYEYEHVPPQRRDSWDGRDASTKRDRSGERRDDRRRDERDDRRERERDRDRDRRGDRRGSRR